LTATGAAIHITPRMARPGVFPHPFMLRAGLVEHSLDHAGHAEPPK